DGASLDAGADGSPDAQVLHAQTASVSGPAAVYVASLGGTPILAQDPTGSACQINAEPAGSIGCLQASGSPAASRATVAAASRGSGSSVALATVGSTGAASKPATVV